MDLESEVEEIAPRLLRYCLGETGDRGLAEEAAQEGLTALVQRWRRQGPPESPAAFAFAIARRRAWRLKLRRRLFEPLQALLDGHRPSPLPGPEVEAAGRTALDRTLKALQRLPGRDREALLVVAAGEIPLEEGARLLGISKSALKMRLHRARQRLQSLLEEKR
ncbi:MAG TPA: sigma-70 family RNA polymerase sigma factor [Thermoanaerobaculia bacterium]|nr:sigma-70 family RNA polymerase sigma factor [Thermoanaerobaculia bacterium]